MGQQVDMESTIMNQLSSQSSATTRAKPSPIATCKTQVSQATLTNLRMLGRCMPCLLMFPSLGFSLRCAILVEWWWMTVWHETYIVPALMRTTLSPGPAERRRSQRGRRRRRRRESDYAHLGHLHLVAGIVLAAAADRSAISLTLSVHFLE